MKRHDLRVMLVIASVLAVLMAGTTVTPVNAGATRKIVTERFAMKLLNCMRTGGHVTTAGKCRGFGSGKHSKYRPPLKRSQRISDKVSWPWAKRTAIVNICGHSYSGSTVDSRFRSAGFRDQKNGESIGCSSGWKPRYMVIRVMRWWQDEKRYNGSHWRQLKDRDFKVAGVAVSKLSNGRTRLVVNFYGRSIP